MIENLLRLDGKEEFIIYIAAVEKRENHRIQADELNMRISSA